MKKQNVHEINAAIGQAIKATFESVEDGWMDANLVKIEGSLMRHVDKANAQDLTVNASSWKAWGCCFQAIIRFEAESWLEQGLVDSLCLTVATILVDNL